MASNIDKSLNSPCKTGKLHFATQISVRVVAIAATLAAAWVMFSNKQTVVVYDIQADARYSYSPAFKFFAIANVIALAFSVISLILAFIVGKTAGNPTRYFHLFLHDLIMSHLLMAACAAATAVGYVGKYGNDHIGWVPICDHFAKFCNKTTFAVALSYLALFCYLFLTIISAYKSRQVQA